VNIHREKAGLMGIRMADAARSVIEATGSSRFILANYWADPKTGVAFQVQVQVPAALTKSVEDLRNLPVGTAGQQPVLLRSIATLKEGVAVAQYDRYNMQRLATLTANYAGTDLGHLADRIDAAIAAAGKPPAKVKVDQRGQVPPLRELLAGLGGGLAIALVIVALLLAAHFQSLRLAAIVLTSLSVVLAGVVAALLLTGSTLNIESFIGAIMAVGVAVANSILLLTAAEEARNAGASAAGAARQAGAARHPDDLAGHAGGHDPDGPRLVRSRQPDRAARPGGHGWTHLRHVRHAHPRPRRLCLDHGPGRTRLPFRRP
jgi:multidrug efflux pump subunit AcrB